jgi:hypothetical protein
MPPTRAGCSFSLDSAGLRRSSSLQPDDEQRDPDSDQDDTHEQERPSARGGEGERSRCGEQQCS